MRNSTTKLTIITRDICDEINDEMNFWDLVLFIVFSQKEKMLLLNNEGYVESIRVLVQVNNRVVFSLKKINFDIVDVIIERRKREDYSIRLQIKNYYFISYFSSVKDKKVVKRIMISILTRNWDFVVLASC